MTHSEARTYAERRDGELRAMAFHFAVFLVTQDSAQFFESAVAEYHEPFYFIFPEHQHWHIEHRDEVVRCHVYKYCPDEPAEH
jgi:hypothetical protein